MGGGEGGGRGIFARQWTATYKSDKPSHLALS